MVDQSLAGKIRGIQFSFEGVTVDHGHGGTPFGYVCSGLGLRAEAGGIAG